MTEMLLREVDSMILISDSSRSRSSIFFDTSASTLDADAPGKGVMIVALRVVMRGSSMRGSDVSADSPATSSRTMLSISR